MAKHQTETVNSRDYPQGFAGTAFNGGLPAPTGDNHVLMRPSGVAVDNGGGMEGVWKALVDAGYEVRPARPTQRFDVPITDLTKRE